MIAKEWRERLTYAAMSAFVAWHALAMIIAPAPDGSEAVKALRTPFQPYLSFFKLDNQWDFFAPNVGAGAQLRYIVEDQNGNHHPFVPDRDLSWFHPSFFWLRSWFNMISDDPEMYADAAGAYFCQKHAALQPIADSPRYRFSHGDILDRTLIAGLLRDFAPDAILHLAAESHVDRSIDGPD